MKTLYSRSAWLGLVLLIGLSLLILSSPVSHTRATVSTTPWTVFSGR